MVTQIPLSDAADRFIELVEQVYRSGRPITIIRDGQPLAELTPTGHTPSDALSPGQAFEQLCDLRRSLPKSPSSDIRSDIEQGRS